MLHDIVHGATGFDHAVATYMEMPQFFQLPIAVPHYVLGHIHKDSISPLKLMQGSLVAGGLTRLVRQIKPAAMVAWLQPSLPIVYAAAWMTGVKYYFSAHGGSLAGTNAEAESRKLNWLSRHFCRGIEAIHYVSSQSRLWHEQHGFPADKGIVISNGIDVHRFKASPPPRSAKFHFLHPARFVPEKNHAVLLAAAAALRDKGLDFKISCVGLQTDGPAFAALVAKYGVGDVVTGYGGVSDIEAWYDRADAVVLSSDIENAPLVVMEALACGRPVVSTRVGIAEEVIRDCGIVVPRSDIDAMARGLGKMIEQRSEYIERAWREGPDWIAHNYTRDKMVEQWSAMLWRGLVSEGLSPAARAG